MSILGGVAKQALQPKIGTNLIGYSQPQQTVAIHDAIHARALVLADENVSVALCSIEVCVISSLTVNLIREAVKSLCDISQVYVFATHTHAAPGLHLPDDWHVSPIETIAQTVAAAYATMQPVKIGAGMGFLQGYSINRRFMTRPVDPMVSVVRVDTMDNKPLGLLYNAANHAVVLGYDNNEVSGDWCGMSSNMLEKSFGDDFVALFSQGGSGDINPITESVREKLDAGYPVKAIGDISVMYGSDDNQAAWNIGDRASGTFAEALTIAEAYNREIKRIWNGITTNEPSLLATQAIIVNGVPDADETPITDTPLREIFKVLLPEITHNAIPMEIMVVRLDNILLIGQPGEVFSETAVQFRKSCQQKGIAFPLLLTNANGWYGYLVPENAYAEGGYEVQMAEGMGLSRRVQDRIWQAIESVILH
jgi:hypothetical protein